MCGKLPAGSAGSVPSGRFSAASGSGVPHQGGAISACAVVAPTRQAASPASRTAINRRVRLRIRPHPRVRREKWRQCTGRATWQARCLSRSTSCRTPGEQLFRLTVAERAAPPAWARRPTGRSDGSQTRTWPGSSIASSNRPPVLSSATAPKPVLGSTATLCAHPPSRSKSEPRSASSPSLARARVQGRVAHPRACRTACREAVSTWNPAYGLDVPGAPTPLEWWPGATDNEVTT